MTDAPEDDDHFIPADYLAEIGRITNAWSHFEFTIDLTTWEVCQIPHEMGACLTAQMFSAKAKMRALISLCGLLGYPDQILKDLKDFNNKTVKPLHERRNRIVHDTRMIHEATQEVSRLQISATSSLSFGFVPQSKADVRLIREDIETMIYGFAALRHSIIAMRGQLKPVTMQQIGLVEID